MCNKLLKSQSSTDNRKALFLLPLVALLAACTAAEETGTSANPGVQEFPIAYVKRSIPLDDDGLQVQSDLRNPLLSMPGGDLYLRSSIGSNGVETNITQTITNSLGDVKDIDVSSDGKKLIFSLQPEDPNPNDNIMPKWDIYIHDLDTGATNRVIQSNISAEEGDDLAPYFLADGRIVFSSNRQSLSRATLLDEVLEVPKPQFSSNDEERRTKALVLHVMDADGTNIKQISFNQSHDLDATVLSDGRILFSRWDRINNNNSITLYTIFPDGTGLQLFYGAHDDSHQDAAGNTVQMTQPRELSNGLIMMMSQPYTDTFGGGRIVVADAQNFVDINRTTAANEGIISGTAGGNVTTANVILDGSISLAGRYASFYPINDGSGRLLVSKGVCQISKDISLDPMVPEFVTDLCIEPYLSDPLYSEVYPTYGAWLYDGSADTERLITFPEPGKMITEVIAMQPYAKPDNLPLKTLDQDLIDDNVGLLKIRSVYDLDGTFDGCFFTVCTTSATFTDPLSLGDPLVATADERPARFIRIVKAVGIPDRNDPDIGNPPDLSNQAFGRNRRMGMKEIIGYNEIQPDGSVIVKVPANIAFYFDILDKNARRIGPRHDSWLQLKPGDTIECSGCHTHSAVNPRPFPHGRSDAETASVYIGAPSDGFVYPNTQNPATLVPYSFTNQFDTMAEMLNRTQAANNDSTSITPSLNVNYTDVWTDPTARAKDTQFSYVYSDKTLTPSGLFMEGLTTLKPFPLTSSCETTWAFNCRIVINYEEHIHPLWEKIRIDPVTAADNTCISCHTTLSNTAVPAAQLDLTGDISDEEVQHIESYRELFFNDDFQELVGTTLVDKTIQVPAIDPDTGLQIVINGVPQFDTIPDPALELSPSMSSAGARFSYFMEKMTESELDAGRSLSASPTTVNHANMLAPAEMRLISEWLDIGGQYFNNPFHPNAPEN